MVKVRRTFGLETPAGPTVKDEIITIPDNCIIAHQIRWFGVFDTAYSPLKVSAQTEGFFIREGRV